MTKEEIEKAIYEKLNLRKEDNHCSGACGNCCLINDCIKQIKEDLENDQEEMLKVQMRGIRDKLYKELNLPIQTLEDDNICLQNYIDTLYAENKALKKENEDLKKELNKVEGLYKQGVSEIWISFNMEKMAYEGKSRVANSIIEKIKEPLIKENEKQRDILDILKHHCIVECLEGVYWLRVGGGDYQKWFVYEITKEQYELIKEWLEND